MLAMMGNHPLGLNTIFDKESVCIWFMGALEVKDAPIFLKLPDDIDFLKPYLFSSILFGHLKEIRPFLLSLKGPFNLGELFI